VLKYLAWRLSYVQLAKFPEIKRLASRIRLQYLLHNAHTPAFENKDAIFITQLLAMLI
jgi:hypothetical protein